MLYCVSIPPYAMDYYSTKGRLFDGRKCNIHTNTLQFSMLRWVFRRNQELGGGQYISGTICNLHSMTCQPPERLNNAVSFR